VVIQHKQGLVSPKRCTFSSSHNYATCEEQLSVSTFLLSIFTEKFCDYSSIRKLKFKATCWRLSLSKVNIKLRVHTSFKEFILALKCGDLSMRRAMSSRRLSMLVDSSGQIRIHSNFMEARRSDTLPTFCNGHWMGL